MTDVRTSQVGLEVLATQADSVRVAQVGAEVVEAPTANVRVAQAGLEVLYTQDAAPMYCYQVAVEVAYVLPQGQIYVHGVQY